MNQVLMILLPILFNIFLGYIFVRLSVVSKEDLKYIGAYVIKVSIPCLLIANISKQDLTVLIQYPYLISYGLASALVFLLVLFLYYKFFKTDIIEASVYALGSTISNTAFIGTSLLYSIIGDRSAAYLSMTFMVENFIVLFMFLICVQLNKANGHLRQVIYTSFINVLKNPIIIGLFAGFLLLLFNIKLPEYMDKTMLSIGMTAAPLGLFVIGGGMYGTRLSRQNHLMRDVTIVAGCKLLILPLSIYIFLSFFANVSNEMLYSAVLLSSLSMAGLFGIFGQQYAVKNTPMVLMITTILGILSCSLVIKFMLPY